METRIKEWKKKVTNLLNEGDIALQFCGNGSNVHSIRQNKEVVQTIIDKLKILKEEICLCKYEDVTYINNESKSVLVYICDYCKDKNNN
ncbi:MAG: hypothetical protein KDD03_10695 [Gelidibacter sp.]|nr:hypothetical protein [Gelidibacter sp.]